MVKALRGSHIEGTNLTVSSEREQRRRQPSGSSYAGSDLELVAASPDADGPAAPHDRNVLVPVVGAIGLGLVPDGADAVLI